MSPEQPLVSVVITTKNEEKNIRACLESIACQSWPRTETIVVDNASSDRTVEIARKFTNKVFDKGPERSAQRNYGMIEKSSGDYVIYVDADMVLSPTLLEDCVLFIRQTHAVALHIPEIVLGHNYFSRVRRFERGFYDGTAIDGARFFHRQTFAEVGGFDEPLFVKGSGEDWDIDKLMRARGVIALLPRTSTSPQPTHWPMKKFVEDRGVIHLANYSGIYHNEAEFHLGNYLKKKFYYSGGFAGYIKKWGVNDPDVIRQFGVKYRFLVVFIENSKWRRLLRRPDLALGMYFLRVLVGAVYLYRLLTKLSKRDEGSAR